MNDLRFNGSLWCNLDIARRNLDKVYEAVTKPLGLTVIEWHVLRALYEKDGQHASELAKTVGRMPTSFTPIVDKLEQKQLTERRPDPADRRAAFIHLTEKGHSLQREVEASAKQSDTRLQKLFSKKEWKAFQSVLAKLQRSMAESET